ncbi:hypothetical protein NDU88_007246 [Pleurodeles waltl]|uniref:Uncharacterized protein n=1 Tax=Pleurodeles waltl TaxID=8319 RepID=A0AAV7TZ64_PLEWA|nr:hypothetical protein NDU88_007246 [Pleurodeles waltl]
MLVAVGMVVPDRQHFKVGEGGVLRLTPVEYRQEKKGTMPRSVKEEYCGWLQWSTGKRKKEQCQAMQAIVCTMPNLCKAGVSLSNSNNTPFERIKGRAGPTKI